MLMIDKELAGKVETNFKKLNYKIQQNKKAHKCSSNSSQLSSMGGNVAQSTTLIETEIYNYWMDYLKFCSDSHVPQS